MEVFMGTVQAFGFSFAPLGWAPCNGQLMSIAQYTALYALMGTYYGGNGQTTFGLPNLQGRTIVGQGTSTFGTYDMGEIGGSANITLLQTQMPMHTHPVVSATGSVSVAAPALEDSGNSDTPGSGKVLAQPTVTTNLYSDQPASGTMAAGTGTITSVNAQLAPAGGSQPVNIESPYLAMNYCIAIEGYFPSRN